MVKWLRDNFAELEKAQEASGGKNAYYVLDKQADQIAAGSDGVIVRPYFMGERSPVWDTKIR